MYAPICLAMKIYCSIYFLDSCCYLFLSATIVITESFLKTSCTAVSLEIENKIFPRKIISSAYNSTFATNIGVNSSVATSNLPFRFLKRQDTDSSHWPSHIHYLVWIFLYAWMFIAILERLPFVRESR